MAFALALPIEVQITSTGFSPEKVVILGGETVRWENTTATPHTVSAQAGAVTFSVGPIAPGEKKSFTFPTTIGTVDYHLDTAATPAGQANIVHIKLVNNAYQPNELTVPVGTTVVWGRTGSNAHDVRPGPAGQSPPPQLQVAASPDPIPLNGTYSFQFTTAMGTGDAHFHCGHHGTMKGVIHVVGP